MIRNRPLRIVIVLIGAATHTLCANAIPDARGNEKNCGPPVYCARTDQRVEPYPATPPPLGPAGSTIRDPSFGSPLLRVTDPHADPTGRGRSFMTPGSAEQNAWNADSTRFYLRMPGGEFVLYEFDPSKMKPRQKGFLRVPWTGEPEFSHTKPNLLYGVSWRQPAFQQYDASTGKIVDVHNISDCLKLTPSDHGAGLTISADDQRMNTVVGPQQDTNYIVYVYDRRQGCRWYNTQTGEVGGQWGPTGVISAPNRFGVHTAKMSKSGQSIWITRGVGTVGKAIFLVWEIGTLNVTPCSSACSGHFAMGYSHVIGPSGANHPLELMQRPLNDLNRPSLVIKNLEPLHGARFWYSHHLSWNHVDPSDTTPVCLSTFSLENPTQPGVPLDTAVPWENEILCVETDGKDSKVWRFAHTYSTAKNGFWSTPRGNVSQDGRFFLFTSDWQDQLGEEPVDNGHYRTDVFVVELR